MLSRSKVREESTFRSTNVSIEPKWKHIYVVVDSLRSNTLLGMIKRTSFLYWKIHKHGQYLPKNNINMKYKERTKYLTVIIVCKTFKLMIINNTVILWPSRENQRSEAIGAMHINRFDKKKTFLWRVSKKATKECKKRGFRTDLKQISNPSFSRPSYFCVWLSSQMLGLTRFRNEHVWGFSCRI